MKIGIFCADRFDADCVLTAAALSMLHPEAEVVYTSDLRIIWDCDLVYHQVHSIIPAKDRDPKLLTSFDETWARFGQRLAEADSLPRLANRLFREERLEGITRVAAMHLVILDAFNPTWEEDDRSRFQAFNQAVGFAKQMLSRLITSTQADSRLTRYVEEQIEQDPKAQILVLEHHCPWWEEIVFNKMPVARFVVIKNGSWSIYPNDCWLAHGTSRDNADEFPVEWDGKKGTELSALTGVSDALFSDNARRIAGAKSLNGARTLANLVLHATSATK